MNERKDRNPRDDRNAADPAPQSAREDNSLAAASEDATREIEKRREGGGYGGFGDIG